MGHLRCYRPGVRNVFSCIQAYDGTYPIAVGPTLTDVGDELVSVPVEGVAELADTESEADAAELEAGAEVGVDVAEVGSDEPAVSLEGPVAESEETEAGAVGAVVTTTEDCDAILGDEDMADKRG